ncbi:MAG: VWA domain-containing protein [Acidobacteriota bacterium]
MGIDKTPSVALAGAILGALTTWAQAQPAPTFSAQVEVVQILATVRDQSGRLVNDLDKEDFILEEEGERQTIQFFSRQSDLPLILGLLVDTSMSQRRILESEREASFQFFEQVLRPEEDLAFVVGFDVEVALLEDLTGSRRKLLAALEDLRVPTRDGAGSLPPIGTVLFDAVFLAADEVLRDQAGRKALVLISDGVDFGSMVSAEEAIEAAQRADSIIYGIRYYDAGSYRFPARRKWRRRRRKPTADGQKTLKQLSVETGGSLFEVDKKQTLKQIFERIQEELRSQYSIGYTPAANHPGSGFRRLRLKTRNGALRVQSRTGYYPKSS